MLQDRYRLIDFGDGRKLESIAGRVIDRPSPAAEGRRRESPDLWSQAESFFDSQAKRWQHRSAWPDDLSVDCDGFRMPVRPTPFGHIGLFPEQYANWKWLRATSIKSLADPPAALNLFGYTGASTLALAAAGYRVAHVDAAKPNVQSTRQAAELNGWQDAPIRYLVDDAAKFAAREVRRGNGYDTIVLDPPAYGHSPQGKSWRLQRDLWPLLDDCLKLVDSENFRLLVTGHSPDVSPADVVGFLSNHRVSRLHGSSHRQLESGRSQIPDQAGRKLDAGFYVRLQCRPVA